MGSVGQDALQDKMAETEEKADPPPAYVEPDAATPDGTTDVVPINKERPDSAWNEPAPVRDPQRLNTHLQVEWDDLIGEPDGVKTMDCAWDLSKKCYSGCLGCCYTLVTCFYAPFLGCYMGIGMAYMVFAHVWLIGPITRMVKMTLFLIRKITLLFLGACMNPYVESAALIFSKMKVRHQEESKCSKSNDNPNKVGQIGTH